MAIDKDFIKCDFANKDYFANIHLINKLFFMMVEVITPLCHYPLDLPIRFASRDRLPETRGEGLPRSGYIIIATRARN